MNNDIINLDYIGVVSSTNNIIEYQHIPINKKYKNLINKLEEGLYNDCDILDLQIEFKKNFPNNTNIEYNYCYPNNYDDSYIASEKKYPQFLTPIEYKQKITEYCNQHTTLDDKRIYNYNLKRDFINRCTKYINAYHYHNTLLKLKDNPSSKVYSTESVGWTVFEYKINKDITFYIDTNFGYGSKSYFYVNLKYKNINILPYSDIIKYYHANMIDVIRYTRSYLPNRTSWEYALQFIADLANQAISNEENFIKKWILEEAQKMLHGLERIAANPQLAYHDITSTNNDTKNLTLYRNITNYEQEIYSTYPQESLIAFQAEKISESLYFLENLQKFSAIYSELDHIITRIKELNQHLLPTIPSYISNIQNENDINQQKINTLQEQIESINKDLKDDEIAIEKLLAEEQEKNPDQIIYKFQITDSYKKDHPKYKEKFDLILDLSNQITSIQKTIYLRNNFIDILTTCTERINTYTVSA